VVLAAAGWAQAQEATQAVAPDAAAAKPESSPLSPDLIRRDRWVVQFEPSVWYASPGGKVTLPGGGSKTRVDDLNLDSPRLSPMGDLSLWAGDWRFSLGGVYQSQEDRGSIAGTAGQIGSVSYAAGDTLTSSMEYWEVDATVGKLIGLPDSINGKGGEDFAATLEVYGGLRFFDVDFRVDGPAGSTDSSEFFGQPMVGVKVSMDIYKKVFTIDVQADIGYFTDGGDSSSFGYDIMVGFQWFPMDQVAVQIGYRDLACELESGSGSEQFQFNGALQGLFGGVVVRF
jgi:opacity protein-like surface antigen